ncbi:MAG: hydantoinase/oxoprolinase family protein [Thiohalomonadaceae bacterium]
MLFLGVDTGGTFTDFVLYEDGALRIHKVLSTPDAPERAILQGIGELGLNDRLHELHLVHGSTVATNAVLEGKGVRTVYIGNRGLRDLLTLGRQARAELYNLQPAPVPPPVPAELCVETGGRMAADGSVVEELTADDLTALRRTVERLAPQAVAINLLYSWRDDRFERAIEQALPDNLFISRSSAVLPEIREYERGIATWLNAWVGPLVEGYLQRLKHALPRARMAVMQSSGETVDAAQAGRQAVRMLLSGPAGGLVGARFVAAQADRRQLLTFDMGGTSTDVALIDGELRLTSEGHIGPWPVAVAQVDMHTIGAGGGSLAWIDGGGLLRVGPQSAGAAPGPACYGRGGTQATVTDANLVLGRLLPGAFLGGGLRLDAAAARAAVARLGESLGLGVEETAAGIVRLADEHMARALRVMSVQRGVDPRRLTLVSFGGAGGLHVCALAESLGMRQALVPVHAGVLSALGMLAAPPGRQLSRTVTGLLADLGPTLEQHYADLMAEGIRALAAEGVDPATVQACRSLDLRYRGQSSTLNIPWTDVAAASEAFHLAHQSRFGHRLTLPVELVNVRLALTAPALPLQLAAAPRRAAECTGHATLYGVGEEASVWQREVLATGQVIDGPALITEQVSTTYLAPGWRCRVDGVGNLVLDFRGR